MSSLIDLDDDGTDPPAKAGNLTEMTVSELSGAVKRTVEDRFSLVRVRGEVGRVSRPRSGHVYLTLKDDRANLDGVIWKGKAAALKVQPQEGLEVVVTGRLTTFPGQSKYQIVIDRLEPAGEGALMAMLDARRRKLAAEGLFDEGRKRRLPVLPSVIGVVTSPSGAVIRDILHRLSERFPRHVLVWPVAVQGERCAPEVAAAIRAFGALEGALRPDVLIVARGGGSLEDLWGFNDEAVVRAAAESPIPLISAVGHETDTTLIDLAADLRAPTPTAAAEKAVPVRTELLAALTSLQERRLRALSRGLGDRRDRLVRVARLLPKPEAILAERRQRLDVLGDRLPRALSAGLDRRSALLAETRGALRPRALVERVTGARQALEARGQRLGAATLRAVERRRAAYERLDMRPQRLLQRLQLHRERVQGHARAIHAAIPRLVAKRREALASATRTLEALSYLRVLDRGFAVVRDAEGAVVTDVTAVAEGDALGIELANGRLAARATDADAPPPKARRRPARKPKSGPARADAQPDLFGDA